MRIPSDRVIDADPQGEQADQRHRDRPRAGTPGSGGMATDGSVASSKTATLIVEEAHHGLRPVQLEERRAPAGSSSRSLEHGECAQEAVATT